MIRRNTPLEETRYIHSRATHAYRPRRCSAPYCYRVTRIVPATVFPRVPGYTQTSILVYDTVSAPTALARNLEGVGRGLTGRERRCFDRAVGNAVAVAELLWAAAAEALEAGGVVVHKPAGPFLPHLMDSPDSEWETEERRVDPLASRFGEARQAYEQINALPEDACADEESYPPEVQIAYEIWRLCGLDFEWTDVDEMWSVYDTINRAIYRYQEATGLECGVWAEVEGVG